MIHERYDNGYYFERMLRRYIRKGSEKLDSQLAGTRRAIRLVASEKLREFIEIMDCGLSEEERMLLVEVIVQGMHQSFCYGYGVGRMEEQMKQDIYL